MDTDKNAMALDLQYLIVAVEFGDTRGVARKG